ncbi:MAG: hypothetical protein C4524_11880 [Candidatus Zixiibacteriota bacterium]|nr:MAG: hypothetical protein C4524_11880 [candidate division Zixibacteria bacterium]
MWAWGVGLILLLAQVVPAQTPSPAVSAAAEEVTSPAAARAVPSAGGEGELIELEAVEIHGEIAQPNVAITVSRAEPQFREIDLERTPAETMTDLDLTAPADGATPVARIREWEEMLKKPRQ